MKKDVWAEFFHLASSNEQPHHGLCPAGEDGWCKYRKAEAMGLPYDHKAHFHLALPIMEAIKPIFRDLAHPDLLRKCLHGGTQNPNESVNNTIWSRIPKSTFVGLKTLQLGVYDAVGCFNIGNVLRCRVYKDLGIDPGYFCVEAMKKLDGERLQTAVRSLNDLQQSVKLKRIQARRRLVEEYEMAEDPNDPSYGAGRH